jgi:hypothetical protein
MIQPFTLLQFKKLINIQPILRLDSTNFLFWDLTLATLHFCFPSTRLIWLKGTSSSYRSRSRKWLLQWHSQDIVAAVMAGSKDARNGNRLCWYHLGGRDLSNSRLRVFKVLGKLNKDLDKTHRSSMQSVDLLKVDYTPTDRIKNSRPRFSVWVAI